MLWQLNQLKCSYELIKPKKYEMSINSVFIKIKSYQSQMIQAFKPSVHLGLHLTHPENMIQKMPV